MAARRSSADSRAADHRPGPIASRTLATDSSALLDRSGSRRDTGWWWTPRDIPSAGVLRRWRRCSLGPTARRTPAYPPRRRARPGTPGGGPVVAGRWPWRPRTARSRRVAHGRGRHRERHAGLVDQVSREGTTGLKVQKRPPAAGIEGEGGRRIAQWPTGVIGVANVEEAHLAGSGSGPGEAPQVRAARGEHQRLVAGDARELLRDELVRD